MVGALLYLTYTRPDQSFAVGIISRYMRFPTRQHMCAVKRILSYVARTQDFGILYTHVAELKLVGHTNSDWASAIEDRRSTSRNTFTMGSSSITGISKCQEMTALSTTEAELLGAHQRCAKHCG